MRKKNEKENMIHYIYFFLSIPSLTKIYKKIELKKITDNNSDDNDNNNNK